MSIDWEQGEFTALLNKKDGIRRGPFGSALKKEFFVAKSDYVVYEQQNAIYRNFKARYNITKEKFDELNKFQLKPDDFIMSGAGTIGKIARVPKKIKPGIFNQALIRFRINSEKADSEYFIQFVRANFMQKKLTGTNPGSAITNLVPMSEVKKWKILFPNITEQHRLGKFLKNIDKAITLQQRKLELLKKMKRGYLQQMFPSTGQPTPQLRFSKFKGDWKQNKLSGIAKITMGQSPKSENYTDNPNDWILVQGNADIKNGEVYPRVWTTQVTKIAQKGDLLLSVRAPVGDVAKTKYTVVIGRGVASVKGTDFIYYLLEKIKYSGYWERISSGSTFESINSNDVKEARFYVPKEITEQKKIGNFFQKLDQTITLQQSKVEKLKILKQSYLQKLFP
ncbi:restriction endonuclease subunit S [Latilactobacillus graminis]|uniref:restriction endonuclease subunit S n=1 Tax=Latilactobacillus graminis TaxID=60519 RepID=UPI001CFFE4D0|nr:restriction endonuclease subunit S [Latilactobacillus graminis]